MSAEKKVGILVEFNYEDLELWYPLLRLKEEGYTVITISGEKGKRYTSKNGYPCVSDESIENVKVEDLAALIIPGGFCPDYLRRDKRIVDLVRGMVESDEATILQISQYMTTWLVYLAAIIVLF